MINILLVDDSAGDRLLFEESMQELSIDYRLKFASSGQQGIDMVVAQAPDIIFMDVLMPGLSGVDFVRLLAQDADLKDIPVIFLTGMQAGELNIENQFFPVLQKPVQSATLLGILSKLV